MSTEQNLILNEALRNKYFGNLPNPKAAKMWDKAKELTRMCEKASAASRIRGDYSIATRHEVVVLPSGGFFASGLRLHDYSLFRIGLGDPRVWDEEVRASGLDVICGRLVLAVLERNIDTATVLIVEQGRGCSIMPAIAEIKHLSSGKWEFVGHSKKSHPAINYLCAKPNHSKEPDDKLWHNYVGVMISLAYQRREDEFNNSLSRVHVNSVTPDESTLHVN